MFNPDLSDLITDLLGPGVHFIEHVSYSADKNLFVMSTRFLKEPGIQILQFSQVSDFQDVVDDPDDDCMDSIIGIHKADERTYVVRTDQREISFKTLRQPELKRSGFKET